MRERFFERHAQTKLRNCVKDYNTSQSGCRRQDTYHIMLFNK